MKTTIKVLTLFVAFALSPTLRAQDAGTDADVTTAQKDTEKAQADVQKQFEKANEEFEAAHKKMTEQIAVVSNAGATAASALGDLPMVQSFIHRLSGGSAAAKPMVIRSSDMEPKDQANLEEDIAVMSHILDKAIDEKLDGQARTHRAMGIDLVFSSGSSSVRNLYLEGYGALFMLNVGFPLVPPPAKAEPQKEEAPVDSTWEEARQELYGQHSEEKSSSSRAEAYSQEKVTRLKEALFDALKSASNIRNLKPDESITLCVFGSSSTGVSTSKSISGKSTGKRPTAWTESHNEVVVAQSGAGRAARERGTTLTIRATKADVDDFAKGKLTSEEFQKKAKLTTYLGGGDGDGGTGLFRFNSNSGANRYSFGFGSGGGGGSGGSSNGADFP